jgi:hypothetical protein
MNYFEIGDDWKAITSRLANTDKPKARLYFDVSR